MLFRAAAAVFFALTAACGPLTHAQQCRHELVIQKFSSQAVLSRYCIPPDRNFSLSFIHSVSLTKVRDDYRIEAGHILQVAETIQTHEAGLPSLEHEPDALAWEWQDGQFMLRMQRRIDRLVVRVQDPYQNRLILGEKTIDLNQWGDLALEISIENSHPQHESNPHQRE